MFVPEKGAREPPKGGALKSCVGNVKSGSFARRMGRKAVISGPNGLASVQKSPTFAREGGVPYTVCKVHIKKGSYW